jgi:hypothetical protein
MSNLSTVPPKVNDGSIATFLLPKGKAILKTDTGIWLCVKIVVDGIKYTCKSQIRTEILNDVNRPIWHIFERYWSKDANNRPSCDEFFGLLEDASFVFDDVSASVVRRFISEMRGN